VHLVCHPQTLLESRAGELGVRVHPLRIRSEVGLLSFFRLARVLLRVQPQIVAFNTPRPILMGNLASRLSRTRVRIIFRRVNFPLRKNLVTRIKYNWGIDCIVAISESISQQLQVGRIPARRIRTVYEGMDLGLYPKRVMDCDSSVRRPFVIGTIAHLSAEKGLQYLVEAAALLPDVRARLRFVIVGDGKCREDLENQVRERGLEECFQFAGFQNQVKDYLNSFDLFILPSLSEGLSSAILNAMASSLPVIATEVGGIPELIIHGENGLLVPPADPVALSQAIQHLIAHPEEARRMGKQGRKRMEEKFTLQRKIAETEKLCRSFLDGPTQISHTAHA
jgi:glycosyltransferase involved in cell wall biosynthesis